MNDILSGTYKGNTYRIKVECYPNTPAIKVQLLPVNAGERITMTQNLGQPLPRYFHVWLRLITRERDYNLYTYFFAK